MAPQQPDNTAVNKHDKNAPTADQAKSNMSDRDMMKNIRHDVVKDKSLSTYGHNVKIIAEHGNVGTMMNTIMVFFLLLVFSVLRLLRYAERRWCDVG